MKIGKEKLAVLFALLALAACKGKNSFDSEKWKSDAGCPAGESDRIHMTSDLEKSHLYVGMSGPEVIALLGQPEARRGKVFVYCVGRGMIDYDEYHITFETNDRVTSFQYVQG